MSFNKIIIIGNLGRDPELRYTPQGIAVCSFTMATNEKRKDKSGELQDITTWFKVTLWRQQAENASKYLSKGSAVYIEGRLRLEEWTDRDNNNRFTLDVQATDMQFISGGSRDGGGEYTGGQSDHDDGYTGGSTSDSSSSSGSGSTGSGSAGDSSTGDSSAGGSSAGSAPAAAPAGDDDIPF